MGIIGFTNAIAKEGAKGNVLANVVVPVAASRLTATVLPPDSMAMYPPEKVASVVLYLCHDSCKENGSVLEVGGGLVNKWRLQRSNGAFYSGPFTAEDLVRDWKKVMDYSRSEFPTAPFDVLKTVSGLIGQSPVAKL
jgi:hypothetical protein